MKVVNRKGLENMNKLQARKRLEYLRTQIEEESISYGELLELQELIPYIRKDDAQLLEWSGVSEEEYTKGLETMKKVTLIGLEIEVEYDEEELFDYEESNEVYQAVVTTDGRLIVWDDGEGGWLQIWKY